MKNLISHISDSVTLHHYLEQNWNHIYTKNFENFSSPQNNQRSNHFNHVLVLGFFLLLGCLALLPFLILQHIVIFFTIILLIFLPILLVYRYQNQLRYKKTDDFTFDLQKRIANCASDVLLKHIDYSNASTDQNISYNLHQELKKSMLIDSTQSNRHIAAFDDTYTILLDNTSIIISECSIQVSQSINDSKNNMKSVFHGYFAIIELAKNLEYKTFLATKKGAYGNDYQIDSLKTPPPNVTQLEWNEFNDLIRVSATNGSEARYILTPDFMVNLFDLWQNEHNEIIISFIGNKAYILWKDSTVIVGKREKSMIEQNAYTSVIIFNDVYSLSKKYLYLIHLFEALPIHLTSSR